jgi:SAM-dependent methyltransferase
MKYIIKRLVSLVYRCPVYPPSLQWEKLQKQISEAKRIIDLGCGNNPVKGASVAVDLNIDPKERALGYGTYIDLEAFKEKNIDFVNTRIDGHLPFKDKEFDFAYSHHAFEHLEDPATACREMMRIATSGAIITPTMMAEFMFGRPYHRWMVMERNDTLMFFKKRPHEDRPFGEHPSWDNKRKKWFATRETNPFDILLNQDNWYHGLEGMPRLSRKLRRFWQSHGPEVDMIFLWDHSFKYMIYE